MSEEGSYRFDVHCGNCGKVVAAEIDKGTSTEEWARNHVCSHCGCWMSGCSKRA